jgi:hypothetical protein
MFINKVLEFYLGHFIRVFINDFGVYKRSFSEVGKGLSKTKQDKGDI